MPTPPSESTKDNKPADTGEAPGIGSFSTEQDIGRLLHNFRNPLTPLVMGIEILKASTSDPKHHQLLDMMHGQVRQLTGMLDRFENSTTTPPSPEQGKTAAPGEQELTGNGPGEVRSVLIIDDNPNILASLQILFEERDYSVLAAMKAEDAIALAENHRPSVCLCDISLPTLDGFEAASELRKAHAGMLMFSMSGFDSREDREQSRAVGFLDHFRKPFIFDEVLQIIENFAACR
jgi:Response regulator containing CheY-like receiver, AAA-type ATPase, and DNA-binding domains